MIIELKIVYGWLLIEVSKIFHYKFICKNGKRYKYNDSPPFATKDKPNVCDCGFEMYQSDVLWKDNITIVSKLPYSGHIHTIIVNAIACFIYIALTYFIYIALSFLGVLDVLMS